jgi:hypothetical protein
MPWEFSRPAEPGKGVPNLPTPEGRELGAGLAHFAVQAAARYPDLPPPCQECALRAGTDANGMPSTLMDVLKCLMEGEPFFCHLGEEPVCRGYAVLARASKEKASE